MKILPKTNLNVTAHYILLASLTLFWGLNWPAMKLVLMEVPVWWFRAICLVGGGMGLMGIALVSRQKILLPKSQLKPLLFCGLFLVFGWHIFTGFGLTKMPAGRSVIIAFTMPLWATILSVPILHESITKRKVLALICGLLGLAVLIGPDLIVVKTSPVGVILMLLAAISWAVGTVLFKRISWSAPTISVTAWLLLGGAIPFVVGTIVIGSEFNLFLMSDKAIFAFAYVIVFPMMFCQWCYLKIVTILPANVAAISTLAIPLVGVLSSGIMLGEKFGLQEGIALVLITVALTGVLYPKKVK